MRPRTVTCNPFSGRNRNSFAAERNITTRICELASFSVKYRWPESGMRRFEISPSTQQSEYSRSRCVRTADTSARTVQTRRSGGRNWKPSWSVCSMKLQCTVQGHNLRPEASDKIDDNRKHNTEQNGGCEGEVKAGILAL